MFLNKVRSIGGKSMREKMKKLLLKANMANVLGAFALLITVVSANQSCVFIFHQPEAPDELKQLRKF